MSDSQSSYNPSQQAIIKLLQDKLETHLAQTEQENQNQENVLSSLKKELDGLLEIGTHWLSELEEKNPSVHEDSDHPNSKSGLSIDIDEEHTPSSKGGQKVPQTTKETKTGLLSGKSGKSDKPQSLNDISEEQKTNPPGKTDKKPAHTATPKGNTKAHDKIEKPGSKVEAKGGKKPVDNKSTQGAKHEEEKKEEKTPEQVEVDKALSSFKTISKKLYTDLADSLKAGEPATKIIEAVCTLVGEKTDIESAKKFLKTSDVIKKLQGVNVDNISDENSNQARELLKDQSETGKYKNTAVTSFLKWANRVIKFRDVKKGIVHPPIEATSTTELNGEAKKEPQEEEKTEQISEPQTTQGDEVKANTENAPSTEGASESKEEVISKEDIAALKAKKNPPAPINAVLDATCIALKIAPKQIGGRKTFDHAALLNTADLQNKINSLNVTTVSKDVIKKLKEYTDKPDFKVEKVQSVPAAANLCKWILSIIEHDQSTSGDANTSTENKVPAEKEEKPSADKGIKRTPTTTTKKEEKKVEEKKEEKGKDAKKDDKKFEKKDDKKVPATPAQQKNQKTPALKEEKKTAPPAKGHEAKKDEKADSNNADIKHINDPLKTIKITEINELKGLAKPPEAVVKLFQALTLLLQNKEHPWNYYQKTVIPNLVKTLTDTKIPTLPKENIEASKKFIADNNLDEATLKKANKTAGSVFTWIEAVFKLLEKSEGKEANVEAHQQEATKTENKEEVKEQKETEEKVTSSEEAQTNTTQEAEHKEVPQETKQKDAPQTNGEKEPSPRASQRFEELQPTEDKPAEETQTNTNPVGQTGEEKTEATRIEANQVEQTEVKFEEAKEEKKTNGTEDTTESKKDLTEILGYDVSSEIQGNNVKDFINQKVRDLENQISAANNQNEGLRQEGVQENPEKKPYEIKESTRGFIGMVEQGWINELLDKSEWDEKIYQILVLFFRIQGLTDIPDLNDQTALRAYASEKLKSQEANLVDYLLGVEQRLNIETGVKIQIQEYLKDKANILTASTFDGVDGLCGVISFLMKEACEYLGIIPAENAKKTSAKEKIYLFNLEKIEFYNQRQNKVIEVAHKHNIPLDSE